MAKEDKNAESRKEETGELNDEELDAVSGGLGRLADAGRAVTKPPADPGYTEPDNKEFNRWGG